MNVKDKIKDMIPHIDCIIKNEDEQRLNVWIAIMDDFHLIWGGRPQMRFIVDKNIKNDELCSLIKKHIKDLLQYAIKTIGH